MEVVLVLASGLFLPLDHLRLQNTRLPEEVAEFPDQLSVCRETLRRDIAGTVKRRGRIRIGFGKERLGSLLGIKRRIAEQLIRERLKPRFTGLFSPGTAFRLIGEVEILEPLLAVSRFNLGSERIRQLSLLFNGLQNGGAAVFKILQIDQLFLERAKLRVIEPSGHFLPVTGNKGHCRPFFKEIHGGRRLCRSAVNVGGNRPGNFIQ